MILAIGGIVYLQSAGEPQGPPSSAQRRPNILLIYTDDQRLGSLGVMPETRRLFERGGTRFAHAFTATQACCPSRATVMTGRYPHNHGVITNRTPGQMAQRTTLQRYLRDAGYLTALAGKYLNTWTERPPHFDRWAIKVTSRDYYYGGIWNLDGRERKVDTYTTDFIGRKAVRFLDAFEGRDDKPWLMYVTPFAPHAPSLAEPDYADAPLPRWRGNRAVFETDRSDKPPEVRTRHVSLREGRAIRARHLRSLMSVDDLVAKVHRKLLDLEEGRRTLIIFTSDSGYLWGEHRVKGKAFPYTPAIKVPFYARWPGHFDRGAVDRRLTSLIDVAPTVLDAAGILPSADPPMDGRSLLDRTGHSRVLVFTPSLNVWTTRTRRYHYTEYLGPDREVKFDEYYDLSRDPWQLRNLLYRPSQEMKARGAMLHAQMTTDRTCSGNSGATACP